MIAAGFMLLSSLLGLIVGDGRNAQIFLLLATLLVFAGLIFMATTRNMASDDSIMGALTFLVAFWLVMPLLLSFPYIIIVEDMTFKQAFFESVSGITTTGASTLAEGDIPPSLHIWRSFLQWGGGVITATLAVVILAAINLRGSGIHRSLLFTLKKGEVFAQLLQVGRVVAVIYAATSSLCFIILSVSGTPIFDSLCLALTSVSTGGFAPREDVLAEYVNVIGAGTLALSCLIGATNIALIWDVVRTWTWRAFYSFHENAEHRGLYVMMGGLFLLGLLYVGPRQTQTLFFDTIFFVTTTGFDYHVIGLEMLPETVLISAAMIGGCALSTAGGIKIIRILLLLRHFETDLGRLTHPSRIVPVRFKGRVLHDSSFLSIWMYFFGYIMAFAAGFIGLSAIGLEFELSVAASAASLSNMGPLLDMMLPPFGFEGFSDDQLLVCATLMILGRLEVLAALTVLTPGLWRS